MRLALVLALFTPALAWAEANVTKADYPASLVERPMILPRWMFQLQAEGDLSNYRTTAPPAGGPSDLQGGSVGFGFDVGLSERLQAGIYFQLPVSPLADFGEFDANLQLNLVPRALSLRFDVGAEREAGTALGGGTVYTPAFVVGVGLPVRVRLGRYFALISGSTYARRHAAPFTARFDDGRGQFGGALLSDDILVLAAANPDGTPARMEGALHLPIGVLFQPISALALAVRTGYRLGFSFVPAYGMQPSESGTSHAVPLALDLMATWKRIDFGFTATFDGILYAATSLYGASSTSVSRSWADVQRYDFWIAGRI